MAEEEEPIEGTGQDDQEPVEQSAGFGEPVDEKPNRARQVQEFGRRIEQAARFVRNTANKTREFIADIANPISKWKLIVLGVDVGVIMISLFILIATGALWFAVKHFGSSPPQVLALDTVETQDALDQLGCFTSKPETRSDDPADQGAITLSAECQSALRQKATAIREFVTQLRERLKLVSDQAKQSQIGQVLDSIEKTLDELEIGRAHV